VRLKWPDKRVFLIRGAFREAKYEKLRRRKSEGGAEIPPPNPLIPAPPERRDLVRAAPQLRGGAFNLQEFLIK